MPSESTTSQQVTVFLVQGDYKFINVSSKHVEDILLNFVERYEYTGKNAPFVRHIFNQAINTLLKCVATSIGVRAVDIFDKLHTGAVAMSPNKSATLLTPGDYLGLTNLATPRVPMLVPTPAPRPPLAPARPLPVGKAAREHRVYSTKAAASLASSSEDSSDEDVLAHLLCKQGKRKVKSTPRTNAKQARVESRGGRDEGSKKHKRECGGGGVKRGSSGLQGLAARQQGAKAKVDKGKSAQAWQQSAKVKVDKNKMAPLVAPKPPAKSGSAARNRRMDWQTAARRGPGGLQCPLCCKPFCKQEQLTKHLCAKHSEHVLACDFARCDFECFAKAELDKHVEQVHHTGLDLDSDDSDSASDSDILYISDMILTALLLSVCFNK